MKGIDQLVISAPAVLPAKFRARKESTNNDSPKRKRGRPQKSEPKVLEPYSARTVTVLGEKWVLERGIDSTPQYRNRSLGVEYPFAIMEVGEAVFIPWHRFSNATLNKMASLTGKRFHRRGGADAQGVPGFYVFREK